MNALKYLAIIKYVGTDFHGFQFQPDKRTVQGELTRAAEAVFGAPTRVTGCSRTDAGVHANGFAVTLESIDGATPPPEKLPLAFARYLPDDLSLIHAEECADGFHPRYDAISKEYVYLIYNASVADPFLRRGSWFLPRKISDSGLLKMQTAAKQFIGKKDFYAFMSSGSDIEDTVREIYSLSVTRRENIIELRISADGFLYNMVRIIVGTLVEVAFGRISAEDICDIIKKRDRSLAGMTAPAEGLYLDSVKYS